MLATRLGSDGNFHCTHAPIYHWHFVDAMLHWRMLLRQSLHPVRHAAAIVDSENCYGEVIN